MRLFIAIEFPPEITERLSQAASSLPPRGLALVKEENLHLTLKFLGEVEEDKLPSIISALEGCRSPPFPVSVKGVGAFPSERSVRVVWAGVEGKGLVELAGCVESALEKIGFQKEVRPFTGHITLARAKAKADVRGFLARFRDFDFGSCTISRLVLKKSTLTPKGPIYEDLHALELR